MEEPGGDAETLAGAVRGSAGTSCKHAGHMIFNKVFQKLLTGAKPAESGCFTTWS